MHRGRKRNTKKRLKEGRKKKKWEASFHPSYLLLPLDLPTDPTTRHPTSIRHRILKTPPFTKVKLANSQSSRLSKAPSSDQVAFEDNLARRQLSIPVEIPTHPSLICKTSLHFHLISVSAHNKAGQHVLHSTILEAMLAGRQVPSMGPLAQRL